MPDNEVSDLMSVFISIGIGFISNVIIMLIVKSRMQNTNITLILVAGITLILAVLTFIFSLFIGGWSEMGLGVISLGALLVPVCLYLYTFGVYLQGNIKKQQGVKFYRNRAQLRNKAALQMSQIEKYLYA